MFGLKLGELKSIFTLKTTNLFFLIMVLIVKNINIIETCSFILEFVEVLS